MVSHKHRGLAGAGSDPVDVKCIIAHAKGQRVISRRIGRANAAYSPPPEHFAGGDRLPWILLATPGEGVGEETWIFRYGTGDGARTGARSSGIHLGAASRSVAVYCPPWPATPVSIYPSGGRLKPGPPRPDLEPVDVRCCS